MNKKEVADLIKCLSSSNKSQVYDVLCKLRNMMKNGPVIEMFRSCGGLESLVAILRYPNEKNLDVSLSILGNCCTKEAFSEAVGQLNVYAPLIAIITNISRDSVLGRACRLLGNLAQNQNNAEDFHAAGAVKAIVGAINPTSESEDEPAPVMVMSPASLAMAVRALRILWAVESRHIEMIADLAVKSIIVVLVRHCTDEKLIKLSPELVNTVLKTLVLITANMKCHENKYSTKYIQCAEQINGDGQGYKCLVSIMAQTYPNESSNSSTAINQADKENARLAFSIIHNLSYIMICRSNLGDAGAVVELVKKVNCRDGLEALVLLCREMNNHKRVKACGGLSALLSVATSTKCAKKQTMALNGLVQFVFNKTSLLELIQNEDLIAVLIKILEQYVEETGLRHEKFDNRMTREKVPCRNPSTVQNLTYEDISSGGKSIGFKRKRDTSPDIGYLSECSRISSAESSKTSSFVYNRTSSVSPSFCNMLHSMWSPGSETSTSYSPDSTPPRPSSCSSDDKDIYSPVCSDNEEDISALLADPEETEPLVQLPEDLWMEELLREHNNDTDQDSSCTENANFSQEDRNEEDTFNAGRQDSIDILVLRLLSRCSYFSCLVPQLADTTTLQTLLRYMGQTDRPVKRTAKTLGRIICRVQYLQTVLNSEFVKQLYDMKHCPAHKNCSRCSKLQIISNLLLKKLRMVAESGCGIGEIASLSIMGTECQKHRLIVTVPLLNWNAPILKEFYVKCGGFQTLLDLITNNSNLKPDAILALSNFTLTVGKKDPTAMKYFERRTLFSCLIRSEISHEDRVRFVLDDDSEIFYSKSFLCQKSDIFRAMFSHNFTESEGVVYLKHVNKESVEYFLHLVRLSDDLTYDTFPIPSDIIIGLEVMSLVDMYMFELLSEYLLKAIVQYMLSPDNVLSVYESCLKFHFDKLRSHCLLFMLCKNMEQSMRVTLFESFLNSMLHSQLLNDLNLLFAEDLKDVGTTIKLSKKK